MAKKLQRSVIAKGKKLKPCEEDASCPRSADDKSQFTVPQDIKDDKRVKEKDVFEGGKGSQKKAKVKTKMKKKGY